MSFPLSRIMSAATASYGVYALVEPDHLGRAMRQDPADYGLLAHTYGLRDLTISTFGLLGRSEKTVTTAMRIRVLCDLSDGILLSMRTKDDETRAKVLGVTFGWAALNALALRADKRRLAKRAA